MKQSERVYRWLLRLYPRDFRDEYGHEMSLLFRARATDGVLSLWWQVLLDLMLHAPREHWSTMKQDLRYAVRYLGRSRGFAAVVVATLALGIGGTTAVFTLMHAVLLAPLPYPQPDQLVRIYQQESDDSTTRTGGMSARRFTALRGRVPSFAGVTGTRSDANTTGLDLYRDGQAQRLRSLHVTSDYFRTFRSAPFRGPGFGPEDESGARRIVLSDALWRARFNSDASVIGTTVQLSGVSYEIAGVASPGFTDPIAGDVDVWVPHNFRRERDTSLRAVIGRTQPGADLERINADLAALVGPMADQSPDDGSANRLIAVALHDDVVAPSRNLLQLLLIAVGLVLLVACVNVANLSLVRATGRVHEFAVRAALGSGRSRLARQLLVESLVLASLGGAAGLALAALGVRALQRLGSDALPRLDSARFDPVVLLTTVAVTVATALAFGVMPALRLAQSDPNRALMQQPRSATGRRRQAGLRSGLAAVQLAFALALLAAAGVLSASFYQLMRVSPGFRTDRVLTFDINLPDARYRDAARRARFHEDFARRLAAIPGVSAAGGTSRLPSTGSINTWPVTIETGPLAGTRIQPFQQPEHRTVSGEFFNALNIPVLAGRAFDERDDADTPMRAVVSANLARIAFPGMPFESVIGQRIKVLVGGSREIIGVVGDVMVDPHGESTAGVYSHHRQLARNRNWALTQVVATNVAPESIVPAIRAVVAAMDPELVVYHVAPMAEIVGRGTSRERFALVLVGVFAGVSLTLAAIGLYGVLAYAVRQRTSEIGIRIALGATAAQIRRTVFRQAGFVLGAGLLAGTVGSLVLSRWLAALAFGISPSDPRVILAAAAILTTTGILAAWLPARRAARIDPRIAMQEGY